MTKHSLSGLAFLSVGSVLLASCSSSTAPITAAAVVAQSSTALTGTVGTAASPAPSVTVVGSNGQPFAGATVTFAVQSGGGNVTGGSATSNAQGVATVGGWTLGTAAGLNTLVASIAGAPSVTFNATGTAGAAAAIALGGGGSQQAPVNTTLPVQVTVRVNDQYGNPVSGATVTFAVTAGGGQLVGASTTTNAQGVAALGAWTLGPTVGANSISASAGVGTPLSISATGTVGAAAKLAITSGNGQAGNLGALPTALTVTATDASGNPVASVPVAFAVTAGSGTVQPATGTTGTNGQASTTLTLTDVGVTNVTVTSTAIAGASAIFNASTGPTLVGLVTVPSGLPRPFAGGLSLPAAIRSIAAIRADASATSSKAAVRLPQPRRLDALTAEEATSRIVARGRLVVTYKPTSFALPANAQAYLAPGMRTQAVQAYHDAMAIHVAEGHVSEQAISPAIGAVLVKVADGRTPEAEINELRQDPRVASVEEDGVRYAMTNRVDYWPSTGAFLRAAALATPATERYPTDPMLDLQLWHYAMVDAPRAWASNTGSNTVRVAIVDTGARPDHPAIGPLLAGGQHFDFTDGVSNPYGSPQPICSGLGSFSTVRGGAAELAMPRNIAQDPKQYILIGANPTCWSLDPAGSHGTHVSGTIGSAANDGIGGVGINWNVQLIAVRVLGVTGAGFDFDIAQGILYAAGLPATYTGVSPVGMTFTMPAAHIMNLSFGGPGTSTVLGNAVAAAAPNTLIVVSAGNSESDASGFAPASFPQSFTVAALDPFYELAGYSNVGAPIRIAAPGGDGFRWGESAGVLSSTWDYTTNTPNYSFYNGTSMSASTVSGVAALVKAANPTLTADQLRARLEAGAIDLGSVGRDPRFGAGVVNAFNSALGVSGPTGTTTVRAIDVSTGVTARSANVGSDGRFVLANLASGNYFLVAGQDEGGDGVQGVPGRRFNWLGTNGLMTSFAMTGTAVKTVALNLSPPVESEPNDGPQVNPLVVNSWAAGAISGADLRDTYSVMIPSAGTYTFETSGLLGACGLSTEADTILRLLNSSGVQLATNDDTDYPTASYPGLFCSRISTTLVPGLYQIEVSGFSASVGTYRLNVRSGS